MFIFEVYLAYHKIRGSPSLSFHSLNIVSDFHHVLWQAIFVLPSLHLKKLCLFHWPLLRFSLWLCFLLAWQWCAQVWSSFYSSWLGFLEFLTPWLDVFCQFGNAQLLYLKHCSWLILCFPSRTVKFFHHASYLSNILFCVFLFSLFPCFCLNISYKPKF